MLLASNWGWSVVITFLEGIVAEKQPTRVVMNVGGVGYDVFIPLSSYDRLPSINGTCRILTYHHVREDAHLLYGFLTEGERALFLLLLTISGIGPKVALRALSGLTVREIKAAIVQNDVARLSSVSGIGRKTAERIVVDLRDKIDAGEALAAIAGGSDADPEKIGIRDAVLALIALGYKQEEARKMIAAAVKDDVGPTPPTEELVRKALGR
jgi:holliday junction DNA helicase RuvA